MTDERDKEKVIIRNATKEDTKDVSVMLHEFSNDLNMSVMSYSPKLSAEDLARDGFEREPPAYLCKIAETYEKVKIGFAIYFPTYSTWEGKTMMLQTLYVRPNYRLRGIGKLLFNEVAKDTSLSGCSRLDWHMFDWNPARTFYEARGGVDLTKKEKWCLYRLSGDALRSYV